MVKSKDKLELLFSGGFDSTFMLCLLARTKNVAIQPYYLDIRRNIRNEERRAVRNILAALRKKQDLKARILPVKIVNPDFFVPSYDVEQAWRKFKDKPYVIGGQQRYLAEFAKVHPGICWGQERYLETPGHMTRLLLDKGNWKFTDDGVGYFTKEDCDPDVFLLFGNLTAPVAKYSELMMWEKIKEWGYEDVFQHIRFCYYPIDGKPCGMCVPCQVKLKQKLDFLFTEDAIRNGNAMRDLLKNEVLVPRLPESECGGSKFSFPVSELFLMYKNPDYKNWKFANNCFLLESVDKEIACYASFFDSFVKDRKGLGA